MIIDNALYVNIQSEKIIKQRFSKNLISLDDDSTSSDMDTSFDEENNNIDTDTGMDDSK